MTLYTTGCSRCRALEKLMDERKLSYAQCDDVATMAAKGFTLVPMLELDDGTILDFGQAMVHVRGLPEGG